MPLQSSSDGIDRADAPRRDQLEISLFGPGYGECVILHIGNGKWIVVDSCINAESGAPAALDYLTHLGVNAADDVVMVVASHWHDDHVRGLSRVVAHCRNAQFICSDALREREFLTLIAAHAKSRSASGSGVQELSDILNVLRQSDSDLRRFRCAMADQCLLRVDSSDAGSDGCIVWALSPSSYSCILGQIALGKLLPEAGPMRRVPSLTPNHAAVALWVCVGETAVLLGSDLEEMGHPQAGWSAIVSSTTRPGGRAHVYKVAHHGSPNGDTEAVWTQLLGSNPVAALTPFVQGRTGLPSPADVSRLCSRTNRAYATGLPTSSRSKRRSSAVERTIREVARDIRPVCMKTGHVRIRLPISGSESGKPNVDLLNGALQLKPCD